MNIRQLIFAIVPWCLILTKEASAIESIGKVVDSYLEGTTTQMLIEVNRQLNTSQTVYLMGGTPVIVREVMSISEKQSVNYYRAYSPGKIRILAGESIFLDPIKKNSKLKEFENNVIFMKKKYATVALVQGDKVLINRGSLHDVDKRDIYLARSSNGKSIGSVELYGIGDFISVGKINQSPEYSSGKIFIGDSLEFIGNRKIIGFGFIAPIQLGNNVDGLGNPWSVYLRNGYALGFSLSYIRIDRPEADVTLRTYRDILWAKKYFFFPQTVSPYILFGFNAYRLRPRFANSELNGYGPMGAVGMEFFPGRLFHLILEERFYYSLTSKSTNSGKSYKVIDLVPLAGVSLNW